MRQPWQPNPEPWKASSVLNVCAAVVGVVIALAAYGLIDGVLRVFGR